MTEITEYWPDADDEYDVLVSLLVPAAQARFDRTHDDWDAMNSQAHGFLALDVAAIGGLVATHELLHRLWWLPTMGLVLSGVLFIASVWPRDVALGPDLTDFHDEMRVSSTLDAARGMFERLVSAAELNDETVARKSVVLWFGMAVVLASLAGALPVVLLRP